MKGTWSGGSTTTTSTTTHRPPSMSVTEGSCAHSSRYLFRHALERRLGTAHASLAAYRDATNHFQAPSRKEYTLIVVTAGNSNNNNNRNILLGQKHRGFGQGFYNSFGGKVEPNESVSAGAARELEEETGIVVSETHMAQCRVGTLHFTFVDGSVEMVVHLFRIRVSFRGDATSQNSTEDHGVIWLDSPKSIRGCEEITPVWFADWREIPLHTMFADDSVWLTHLLESKTEVVHLDAWFHFQEGGQETNTILHYFVDLNDCDSSRPLLDSMNSSSSTSTTFEAATIGTDADEQTTTTTTTINNENDKEHFSLEKRLFHALRKVKSPSIKEFNESFAFVNAVRAAFGRDSHQRRHSWDYVIDVAGGHGALAALFLLTTSAHTAVVVDPARVGQIETAWGPFLQQQPPQPKMLRYRHECLRTGLPAELDLALQTTTADRILVVACHACQHLSDEILNLACRQYRVHAAVLPCCQRDMGGAWKAVSHRLDIPIGTTMDLLLAGKCLSWGMGYDVRIKVMDPNITPQNRIIVCRSLSLEKADRNETQIEEAHRKLAGAYRRAHRTDSEKGSTSWNVAPCSSLLRDARFLGGAAFGVLLACAILRR